MHGFISLGVRDTDEVHNKKQGRFGHTHGLHFHAVHIRPSLYFHAFSVDPLFELGDRRQQAVLLNATTFMEGAKSILYAVIF